MSVTPAWAEPTGRGALTLTAVPPMLDEQAIRPARHTRASATRVARTADTPPMPALLSRQNSVLRRDLLLDVGLVGGKRGERVSVGARQAFVVPGDAPPRRRRGVGQRPL